MLTEVRAKPVIGPVVSSDRITSRKGPKNALGSISSKSEYIFRIKLLSIEHCYSTYLFFYCLPVVLEPFKDKE